MIAPAPLINSLRARLIVESKFNPHRSISHTITMTNRRQTGAFLLLLLVIACATAACGGGKPATAQDDRPPLDLERIRRDINGRFVRVPAADGKAKPINWVFDSSEPKEVEIVEQKIEGDRATFLVNMKTHTGPRARNPRGLTGQLRLHYELQSGLVLREWEIVEVENVSFTYTDEPAPSPTAETKKRDGDEDEEPDGERRDTDAKQNANGSNANAKPNANANAKPVANRNTSNHQ